MVSFTGGAIPAQVREERLVLSWALHREDTPGSLKALNGAGSSTASGGLCLAMTSSWDIKG